MANGVTPNDIAKVLTRIHFKLSQGGDNVDEWVSRSGKVHVDIYPGGRWWILYEEVRKKGYGIGQLIKALKNFPIQESRINEDELEELTGTGGVAGFGTPYAFATKEPVSSKGKKRKVHEGKVISLKALIEGGDPYYPWRNDETQTPKQKIGRAISEINKQMTEVEKVVRRTQRLKNESGTANGELWNRTNKSLMKIESRMHRISQTIRNMRG